MEKQLELKEEATRRRLLSLKQQLQTRGSSLSPPTPSSQEGGPLSPPVRLYPDQFSPSSTFHGDDRAPGQEQPAPPTTIHGGTKASFTSPPQPPLFSRVQRGFAAIAPVSSETRAQSEPQPATTVSLGRREHKRPPPTAPPLCQPTAPQPEKNGDVSPSVRKSASNHVGAKSASDRVGASTVTQYSYTSDVLPSQANITSPISKVHSPRTFAPPSIWSCETTSPPPYPPSASLLTGPQIHSTPLPQSPTSTTTGTNTSKMYKQSTFGTQLMSQSSPIHASAGVAVSLPTWTRHAVAESTTDEQKAAFEKRNVLQPKVLLREYVGKAGLQARTKPIETPQQGHKHDGTEANTSSKQHHSLALNSKPPTSTTLDAKPRNATPQDARPLISPGSGSTPRDARPLASPGSAPRKKLTLPDQVKETEYMTAVQRQKARVARIRRCIVAATVIQRAWKDYHWRMQLDVS